MAERFYFRGSPLQFFDTVEFATEVDAELASVRFAGRENKMNPRQIDLSTPRLGDWSLARVKVSDQPVYSHVYKLTGSGGFVINCFRGEPLGMASSCGAHLLWWIRGSHIVAVERTVKKKAFSSATKVTDVCLHVRASSPEAPASMVLPVNIDASDNDDDAAFADNAVRSAAEARKIAVPKWPEGVGVQRLAFD